MAVTVSKFAQDAAFRAMFPVQHAYATDDVVRALVDEWVARRRCPRPLVDRLLDLGLEDAADCARWASDEVENPDQSPYRPSPKENPSPCGPYPTTSGGEYYWMPDSCLTRIDRPHWVPQKRVGLRLYENGGSESAATFPDCLSAIIALLEVWRA